MSNGPVLVTGASGFIGSHLARRLALSGVTVMGGCTDPPCARRLMQMPPAFTAARLDLREPAAVEALFARHRFSTVFHLAAHGVSAAKESAHAAAEVNTLGAFTLAQVAARHSVSRFVYCGSALEYQAQDHPADENTPLSSANFYGASKAAGWMLMDFLRRTAGLPMVTVRPFSVYGPDEDAGKLVPHVILHALRREPMQLTPGTQVRDYLHVDDVVDALLLAADHEVPSGASFNLGHGPAHARPVRAIVESILDLTGAPRSLALFGEASRTRPDAPYLICNPARALAGLGWASRISLEDGLRRTIDWYARTPRAATI